MKRPQFIAALVALGAAPFVSLSKEKPPLPQRVLYRESYVMPKEDAEIFAGNMDVHRELIGDKCLERIMYNLRRSPHLKRMRVERADGSVEFLYWIQVLS